MENITAEEIGKKARALKHCIKVLEKVDKKGSTEIVLNCTGVKFIVHQNDALYLEISATKARLAAEIGSYKIVQASTSINEMDSASVSAEIIPPPLTPKEKEANRKAKKAAYMKEYMKKRRAKAIATT